MSLHPSATVDVSSSVDRPEAQTVSDGPQQPAWLYGVAAAALGLTWPGGRTNVLADAAIELTIIVLLFLAVTQTATFRSWWSDIPRPARRTSTAVVAAIVFVHFFSIASNAFPLTQWTMYTRTTPDIAVSYNLVGYTDSGDEVSFAPSVANRTMTTKLAALSVRGRVGDRQRALSSSTGSQFLEQIDADINDRVALLAELYNERSPDEQIVEATIFQTTFTYEQRRAGKGTTEAVWTQIIGPDEAGTP